MQRHLDSKIRVANMGPTWVLSAPDEPHVGPNNLAIRVQVSFVREQTKVSPSNDRTSR